MNERGHNYTVGGRVVTPADAPQVEPLKLTLEEALTRTPRETGWYIFHNGVCWMVSRRDHLGFTFEHGSWNEWEGAASHAWGRPVERRDDTADLTTAYMVGFEKGKDAARDDTAELVEALKVARDRLDGIEVEALRVVRDLLYGIKTARSRSYDLHYYVEGSARAGVREIDAALARVKGDQGA